MPNKDIITFCKKIAFALLLFLFSCSTQNHFAGIENEYIEKLTNGNDFSVSVVIPIEGKDILIVENIILLNIYDKYYKKRYDTPFAFYRSLYDNKVTGIDQYLSDYRPYSIKIDKGIISEYYKKGISFIINNYLTELDKELYEFKNNSIDNTVTMIMFINGFYVYFDDMRPNFIFQKELNDYSFMKISQSNQSY